MATTEISATTVYWEKVDVPIKWRRSLPLHLNLEVPSGMTPLPWVARILPQRLVLPDLQNLHSLHSGVLSTSVTGLCLEHENILERNNVVSDLHVGNTLSNGLNNAGTLVPQNNGEGAFGILSGQRVCI